MKKFLLLLIIFPIFSFAQRLQILDKTTNEQIAFAIIMLDTSGYYTNKHGEFYLGNKKFDSISISHLGYETLKLHRTKIQDTLYLTPKAIDLGEVELLDLTTLKKMKLKRKHFINMFLFNNSEVITCLCSKSETVRVASFYFKLGLRETINTTKDDYIYNAFRLNIYENENFKPSRFLRSVDIIELDNQQIFDEKPIELLYDFGGNPLEINVKGVCFGLENITHNVNSKTTYTFVTSFSKKYKTVEAKSYHKFTTESKSVLIEYENHGDRILRGIKLIPDMYIYK